MAPLVVEGDTLGQKHRNHNILVNESTQEVLQDISYEEPDLDNLYKIDVACKNKNVEYIMGVLQCEDMLYVSRAIKRSTWLITDPQYAHIVNPTYLNDQLSPNMMAKAFNKLILHIRLHLKNEKRVDEFFNYYEERNLEKAIKWLPDCTIQLTENIIQKYSHMIPYETFKRISKKSITFWKGDAYYQKRVAIETALFYLKTDIEKYLDIVETYDSTYTPPFDRKATKFIMEKSGERVFKNLKEYSLRIHIPTFAKFVKRKDLKNFITTNIVNYDMRAYFEEGKINSFINRMPLECRFEFINGLVNENKENDMYSFIFSYFCGWAVDVSENLYRLYSYATFDTAFVFLKKLIRSELNREKKISMIKILFKCARKDTKNIRTLVKYYHETHSKEPVEYMKQFVDLVIEYENTHHFDNATWGYLNDLLKALGVYNLSETPGQNYLSLIIIYCVIHDEHIPDVIENKFLFDTLKVYREKLTKEENEKVFLYLYRHMKSKINTVKMDAKRKFIEIVTILANILDLLVDWEKNLKDFPIILDKIKEIILINRKNKWCVDISALYKKIWRRNFLFAHSIALSPTQDVCINALKHRPELLETFENEVISFCLTDHKKSDLFLKKVRIYWPQSLSNNYKKIFINEINNNSTQKAAIVGLSMLLQKNEFSKFIQKHVPTEYIIDWSQPNNAEVSLRKHISSSMHLARPYPSPDDVMLYAKGDYIQFVLGSLNSVFYNMCRVQTREYITLLFDSPGPLLQKFGVQIAFSKLNHDEIIIFMKSLHCKDMNKNDSIPGAILNQTFDFLCKQNEPMTTRKLWELLSGLIDNLTPEENKSIYTKLSKFEKVPMSVRPEFFMKNFKFLKSLPPKANCRGLLNRLKNKLCELVKMCDFLDDDFFAELVFESFNENFSTKRYQWQFLVADFVLSTKSEEAHVARYNKILVPILERSFAMWNICYKGTYYVRENLKEMLSLLDKNFKCGVVWPKMILPLSMYTDLLKRLCENLPIENNYVLITTRKLSLDYVKLLDKIEKRNGAPKLSKPNACSNIERSIQAEVATELGKLCVNYLNEDAINHFSTVYKLFGEVFEYIFENYFNESMGDKLQALKAFLENEDFIPGYLFLIESVNSVYIMSNKEKALKSEIIKKIRAHPSKEVIMFHYVKEICN